MASPFTAPKLQLYVDRIGYRTFPGVGARRAVRSSCSRRNPTSSIARNGRHFQGADATSLHAQNFRSQQVRTGHKGAVDEMVGAYGHHDLPFGHDRHAKTGNCTLHWNAQKEDFEGDSEASKLLTRDLRAPYNLIRI